MNMPDILKDNKGNPIPVPYDTNMLPPREF